MRSTLKKIFNFAAIIFALPCIVLVLSTRNLDKNDAIFVMTNELLSLLPGIPGIFVRRAYYNMVLDGGCKGLTIGTFSIIVHRGTKIDDNVYIGSHCDIGLCHIQEDVLIGSHVNIISGKHVHFFDDVDTLIRHQGGEKKQVVIAEGAWIANNATILEDVAAGCVIGAGAVLVKNTEANGIYAGNPARLIRFRGKQHLTDSEHTVVVT